MYYNYDGTPVKKYPTIVGDGVADDTAALQAIINNNACVQIPESLKIRITQPININIRNTHLFDGGNSSLIVDGSFCAINITGSLTSGDTSNPNSLNINIKEGESAFILRNCKIVGTGSAVGGDCGINISGCFKTRIENCYFYNLTDGISIENQNRDLMFSGNQIYAMFRYGLHIKPSANLHQFNVVDNMVQYCQCCIYLDNPEQIANWQCTGNDIEISTYPNIDLQNQRCILIDSTGTKSGQLSEIEIVGNTLQGHNQSTDIVEIKGGTNRYVQHTSISGNHISNSANGSGILLSKANGIAINGNTFKNISDGACVEVADSKNISITGNTFDSVGSFATIDSKSQNVVVVANSGESAGTAIVSGISGSGFSEGLNTIAEGN